VTGVEAVGWHFNFFPTFWVGINKNKNTQRYTELFINNCLIHEYIDRVLKDERISLNDSMIANFIEIYYGKVRTQLSLTKLLEVICLSMVHKENWEEICGDLHAVRIIGQTGGFPKSSKENLKRSLQSVLQKSKEFAFEEESPPKRRKLDATQANKSSQGADEKLETEETASKDTTEDKEMEEPNADEAKSESESKETEKAKASSAAPIASGSNLPLTSSRNDLIKDIESHIEIIYECLDELNETGPSSSVSKTASNEIITLSSSQETESQEADKSLTESVMNDGETANDPPAQDESRND